MISAGAFAVGVVVSGGSEHTAAVERFAAAWSAQDFESMHAELSPAAQAEYEPRELERTYASAARTATITGFETGDTRGPIEQGDEEVVPLSIAIDTASFGAVEGEIAMPVSDDGVDWRPNLVFPGLARDEQLDRNTRAPERAPILARDRSPLAEGPADARTTNGSGGIVTGELGEAPTERARQMASQGFPEDTPAGINGLELAFDGILAGTAGGRLLARGENGSRVLAAADPIPGEPVRTTIDPAIQDAAAAALGDQFGGIAVLDAGNGNVLGLAGIAFSAPQPPGSTFKVITAAGALETDLVEPGTEFPVETSTSVEGYEIFNADDSACGGDFTTSFAKSCNTVFAPLGAELGADDLVRYTELFGFNSAPTLYREDALAATQPPQSTIPSDLEGDLNVAVSAIGQGEVLATPLAMASVAQTIANDGVRSPTALVRDPELAGDYPDVEVTSAGVADEIETMMVEVVSSGTGTAAALPDVAVAGKTGTAELGPSGEAVAEGEEPAQDINAWFTSYAPAKKPKIAVAVMIVDAAGGGGAVAAPIARSILEASL